MTGAVIPWPGARGTAPAFRPGDAVLLDGADAGVVLRLAAPRLLVQVLAGPRTGLRVWAAAHRARALDGVGFFAALDAEATP